MAAIVSAVMAASLASAPATDDNTYYWDLYPACACKDCKDGPVIKDEAGALIVGEAFGRLRLSKKDLAQYKPTVAFRHERSRSGPIWSVLWAQGGPETAESVIAIIIDGATGCLLGVSYPE